MFGCVSFIGPDILYAQKIMLISQSTAQRAFAGIRPEISLILCCARTFLSPPHSERMRALVHQDLDWDYLVRLAIWHRVAALVYRHLSATCPHVVPQAALGSLRAHAQILAVRNLNLAAELLAVLSLFKTHGIAAAPFKGPATAALIYGDLSLREFDDLDILLHREQALQAKELLAARGYRPHRNHEMANGQESAFLHFETTYTMVHETTGIAVDLHWEITRRYFSIPITLESLRPGIKSTIVAGNEVLAISPEDLLLILCIHGAKHLWAGLDWICDIAELVNKHRDLDWKRLVVQAESLGSRRILNLGLYLAHDLLETSLPPEMQQRIRSDRVAKKLSAQVCAKLFTEMEYPPPAREKFFFLLRARERWGDKIHYVWRCAAMPSGRDMIVFQLPEFLMPLYWLLKPVRLVFEMILRLKTIPASLKMIRT
jgi:hypothetical protein